MLAFVVKKLHVTSSPQCSCKAVSAIAAKMSMYHLCQVHLGYARAAKHLEDMNILKLGSLIKLIKVMFSEGKRILKGHHAGCSKHCLQNTSKQIYMPN